ncbi:MAG: trigger factor [Acidobacteria bacterium]|nr:trigger factor [Acidobacteriota bacterium]
MALIEGCKHQLPFTIPLDDVAAEMDRVTVDIQKKAALPGFRPGKAPVSIIRTRFGADIRQKVLENLVPRALSQRFSDENLKVVGQPNIKELKFEPDSPIEFTAEFEIAPEFDLGEYVGVEVAYTEPAATDEEVEARLEEIRNQKADFINEDPRPAADGDHAAVSLISVAGVEPPMASDEMVVEIGDKDTMPEFTEHLRGVTPGETKEFDVTYPEEYGQEKLAGKTVRFAVTLKQLRRKELPELNDDFAQDLGDFKTIEEVREAIRTAILREKEQQATEAAKTSIIDKLVDAHQFPVPEAFVDRQIEIQAENYLRSLAAQGVDINKDVKLDWNKLKESQGERATRDVRGSLILERVADREAIAATNEDVDKEVQRMARASKEAPAVVRMKLEKDGGLGRIASRIRTEKTLQFLFDKSRKVAS